MQTVNRHDRWNARFGTRSPGYNETLERRLVMSNRQPVAGIVLSSLCTQVASAAPVGADTLHVPGDHPTIQAAMDAAQAGDTVLVADGVYTGPGIVG